LLLERDVICVGKGGYSSKGKIVSAELLPFRKSIKSDHNVVVTQVPLHGIRLSQRELHQMNVPDVKVQMPRLEMKRKPLLWSNRLRRR